MDWVGEDGGTRRLFAEESRREAHARLMVERSNDPAFPHRNIHPDGSVTLSFPAGSAAAEAVDGLRMQAAAFREKFGREMGPQDPVFFDPTEDKPVPLTHHRLRRIVDELAATVSQRGGDPAFLLAFNDVGYMITSQNEHLFSVAEVDAYWEAVAVRQGVHVAAWSLYKDLDGTFEAPEYDCAAWMGDVLQAVIAQVVESKDADAAFEFRDDILPDGEDGQYSPVPFAYALAMLTAWLGGARAAGAGGVGPLNWAVEHLDRDIAAAAMQVASIVGHPFAPSMTMSAAVKRLGPDVVTALICLAAGAVGTSGGGDAAWLRQFDRPIDGDNE